MAHLVLAQDLTPAMATTVGTAVVRDRVRATIQVSASSDCCGALADTPSPGVSVLFCLVMLCQPHAAGCMCMFVDVS